MTTARTSTRRPVPTTTLDIRRAVNESWANNSNTESNYLTGRMTRNAGQTKPAKAVVANDLVEIGVPRTTTFQWVRGELIGKGSYGRVYLALNVTNGELMAVKQIEVVEALKFESETLKNLEHPNVVQYLGFEETPKNLNVFLEYVPGGTIGSSLSKHGRFSNEVTKWFTLQILAGLEYIHSTGILHRDLKGDNILVEPSGVCKISDFGISKKEDMKGQAFTELRGTVYWRAPEVIDSRKKGYDSKVDIWSLGCVVHEMWSGERPWQGQELVSVMLQLYKDKQPPPLPNDVALSDLALDFRRTCFAMNPRDRPTARALQSHPYLEPTPGWVFDLSEIERSNGPTSINGHRKGKGTRSRNSSVPASRHRRTATDAPPLPGKHSEDFSTIRPADSLYPPQTGPSTSRPSSRSPSRPPPSNEPPPVVYITPPSSPVRVASRNSMSSATSGSTRASSRSSQPRRKSFRVVNPDPEPDDDPRTASLRNPYIYNPPPLPTETLRLSTSRPLKQLYGSSSVADFKAGERRIAPTASVQDLAFATSSAQKQRPEESYSESDSDSNAGTLFWKKRPVGLQANEKPSSTSDSDSNAGTLFWKKRPVGPPGQREALLYQEVFSPTEHH
ncbi:kinase-like domain-containing protein [Mycena rebaudengoi]|nr:kinase-like domain-containing protein [Mycena rebaudengoi]